MIGSGTWGGLEPRLGAPDGYTTVDFPSPLERGNVALVRIASELVDTPVAASNLFFIASFFLVLWTALAYLWVWRPRSLIAVPLIALGAANAPFHFMKEAFFASNYVLVVPALVCALLLLTRDRLSRPQLVGVWVWVLATPFFGLYWAIGGAFVSFWTMVGLLLARKSLGGRLLRFVPVIVTAQVVWVITWAVVDTRASYLLWSEIGQNRAMVIRNAGPRADDFAMRLIDLVLVPDYFPNVLSAFKRSTWISPPMNVGEGAVAAGMLGLVAGTVVLVLMSRTFLAGGSAAAAPPARWIRVSDVGGLSWLAIGFVLVASYGGLGSLTNIVGVGAIQSWERFGFHFYVIALMLSVCVAASYWNRRLKPQVGTGFWWGGCLVPTAVVTSVVLAIPVSANGHGADEAARRWSVMASFYSRVEVASAGRSILFLPPEIYPEGPRVCAMPVYSSLWGFVLTDSARWSSGAYTGRDLSASLYDVMLDRPSDIVSRVAALGYQDVVLDMRGLSKEQRAGLVPLLQNDASESFASTDGNLRYFRLASEGAPAREPAAPTMDGQKPNYVAYLNLIDACVATR